MSIKLKSTKTEKVEKVSRSAGSKAKSSKGSKAKSKTKKESTRKGTKVSGDGKYPNVPFLFDKMYTDNKNVSYRKVADEVKKHFPEHKPLSEASFGRKTNRHETKGYNSKRWFNEFGSKPKSKSRSKKTK